MKWAMLALAAAVYFVWLAAAWDEARLRRTQGRERLAKAQVAADPPRRGP
jgi:hypothetical protein